MKKHQKIKSQQQKKTPKYLNTKLPIAERVADLISRLTIDEKVAQMMHRTPAIPRLGIPAYNWWNECLHGVGRAGRATVFPQAIGMAASFDAPLMQRVATAISDEARAKYHQSLKQNNARQYFGLTYWSPNINIFRDPRWGRGHETFGEDPYLTARIGVSFVKGLQGNDTKYLKVVATPKHYAVHSGPEAERHHFNAVVSPKDLRETYLPAFKDCIIEGKAFSIMGAYNRTDGEPCCASNTLLQKILRDEWGFEGYVVSDCDAVCDIHRHHQVVETPQEAAALAVKNGCDLNCGGIYSSLLVAVDQKFITEDEIDVALNRLFIARFKLGMFDPQDKIPYSKISPSIVNGIKHQKLARQMARESIVLLKNEANLLPLDKNIKGIAVIGPTACEMRCLLANYNGFSPNLVTPFEGIIGAVSAGTQVEYSKGCLLAGNAPIDNMGVAGAVDGADVIIAVLGYAPQLEGEEAAAAGDDSASEGGGDRTQITLPGRQEELLKLLYETGKPVVLVLTGGSPIAIPWAAEHIPAILMAWYPGEQGGNAIADVIFGDYNPSGRLPVTFVKSLDQVPPFSDYNMDNRTYKYMKEEPLFPFGFGLSYTKFQYGKLILESNRLQTGASLKASVEVCNKGKLAGDEVVQLYLQRKSASVRVPRWELCGFKRISLKPREKRTVSFTLAARQMAIINEKGLCVLEPGEFEISIGGAQPDNRSKVLGARPIVTKSFQILGNATQLKY